MYVFTSPDNRRRTREKDNALMTGSDAPKRHSRFQFTIGSLLWLLCFAAIGLTAYNRWIANDYSHRAIDAEMVARDNGVKIIRVWISHYGDLPPRLDSDGKVNLHDCRPYVDFTDPTVQADDIKRLIPHLQELLPDEGKRRVGLFISTELFADSPFVAHLRDELPRCEIFDGSVTPGFFRQSKP